MKLTLVLAIVLLAAVVVTINARNRRARESEAAAAAQARQRAARRNRVPDVSSNLKGVTATQTMQPYRPGKAPVEDEDAA